MNLKNTLMLILLLGATLFTFSGCGEKIKYVYIKTPCPSLQTFDVNTSKDKHFDLHYTVKDANGTK